MTDLLRSYPDPLKAEQHDQRGRPGSDIEFVGLPSSITASQLRDSLPLFPFQREQLLIFMRAGAESAFAPGLPADRG